jgi:receptor expression-enhancing protein 5/6
MDQVNQMLDKLAKHFDEIPFIKQLSERTKVPSSQLVIGIIVSLLFFVVFGLGASLIVQVVGILYPAYMSFKAIESPEEDDDKMWLTYWAVFALYNFADRFIDYLFFWVPCYHAIKLIVLVYMFFPTTRGAIVFYNVFARPFFLAWEAKIDSALSEVSEGVRSKKSE